MKQFDPAEALIKCRIYPTTSTTDHNPVFTVASSPVLTDPNGFSYYDHLPDGFVLAVMDDFIERGRRRIGMEFVIQWAIRENYYQLCRVSETLTRGALEPFMNAGRVFIHKNNRQ